MIYTITFNPSIDYIVGVNHFEIGKVNRTMYEYVLPGGKGINVSIVLNNLGIQSTALGFVAGFTGNEIKSRAEEDFHIKTDFIEVENGFSRINFKMKSDKESEVNGNGPMIEDKHLQLLKNKLRQLTFGDVLVLSGSIPKCISNKIYSQIMKELEGKGIEIVVDATGELLMNVLEYKPFLIKPNNHELEEMFHVKHLNDNGIVTYAKKLQELGAQNVLVSMAGDGAILVCQDGNVYQGSAPKGVVKNSVGAGDSMLAGFITGFTQTKDYCKAFQMGIATGSASAFSENLATKQEVENLLSQVEVKVYGC